MEVGMKSGTSSWYQPSSTASCRRLSKRPVGFESAPRPLSGGFLWREGAMPNTVHPSRSTVKCLGARDNGVNAGSTRGGGRMSESGQPVSHTEATSKDERNLAMFAHLSAFAGLLFPAGGNVIAP